MMIPLPEKFEVGDIVMWKGLRTIPFYFNLSTKQLYFVKEVHWSWEKMTLERTPNWYQFKDFTIVKKNCPIVKLIV